MSSDLKTATENLINNRNQLKEKIATYTAEVNKEYTKEVNAFIKKHSPVKKGQVYELTSKEGRRRGYKRFVVYSHEVKFMAGHLMLYVGGWWLNANHIPEKWDALIVLGVSNPSEFKLSDDQSNEPHPEADKE